jgi:sucrose-6-phosphate hydrolase SacC (GH32 family)
MKSTDLERWELVGDFLAHDTPDVAIGEDVSCPNLFQLDGKWVLMCISHPLGCRYYVGDWDPRAEQFVPERQVRLSWRRDEQPIWGVRLRTDYFAPETVVTADGRRVLWAWVRTLGPDGALLNKTIQALPRELRLGSDGLLRMRPLRELESLRHDGRVVRNVLLDQPIEGFADAVPPTARPALQHVLDLDGDSWELRITVSRAEASRKILGFVLFSDGDGGGLPIVLRPETGTLRVGTVDAPFAVADLADDEDVVIRVYIDHYMVEVFANDRQAVASAQMEERANGLDAFTVGAPTTVKSVEAWRVRPTNAGFLRARESRVWQPAEN